MTYTISIHVLREEDDLPFYGIHGIRVIFQSTSSARRTTIVSGGDLDYGAISIHVLREEDDGVPSMRILDFTISIHVLREEDDVIAVTMAKRT